MKLRLSDNQITFRIQRNELEHLQTGGMLSHELPLPDNTNLTFSIVPVVCQEPISLSCLDRQLHLEVSMEALEELAKTPSKEGISGQYTISDKKVVFSIEVDLFSGKKEKK